MKKVKRYLAKVPEEKTLIKLLNEPVWNLDKKIPNVPYYCVEVKVKYFEPNYDHNRPTPNFFKRFCGAIKAAKDVFMMTLERG